jgi:hypothetical protein
MDLSKEQLLHDMQMVYEAAFKEKKWYVALKAKELQGRVLNVFAACKLPEIKRIADFTEDDLKEFVARLEKNDSQLKPIL